MRQSTTRLLSGAAVGAAAATTAILAVGAASPAAHNTAAAASLPRTTTISRTIPTLTASEIYKRDSTGVVAITATSPSQTDSGTGVVLNDSGLILTNDHVVSGASSLTVAPGNSPNTTRTASVVGEDPDADLAVIKVNPSGLGLTPLSFADSSSVTVGQAVYAIGNPYGLDETLTTGIVSALGRQLSAPDGATINGAIQTDAALNPGNSGGPLIDAQGNVIGINSQIASDESDSGGGQPGSTGVGFAISSNTATQVAQQIESTGASIPSTQQSQSANGQTQSGSSSPFGSSSGASPYGSSSGASPYGSSSGASPYGSSSGASPYGSSSGASPYGSSSGASPYGSSSGASPYGSSSGASPYGSSSGASPYGSSSGASPYGSSSGADPYGSGGYGSSSGTGSSPYTIVVP